MAENPLRFRASGLPAFSDCQLRAAVQAFPEIFRDAGFELGPRTSNVGALIGTGVHAAAELALTEKLNRGADTPLSAMEDAAIEGMRARLEEETAEAGLVMDNDTRSMDEAERQARRMTGAVRSGVVLGANPVAVERHLEADVADGVVLSGHGDLLHVDQAFDGKGDVGEERVRDLKSTRRKSSPWRHAGQVGAYSLLYRAHGFSPRRAQIDELPRVSLSKPQPAIEHKPLRVEACEQIAWTILGDYAGKMAAFVQDGDPSRFIPNPTSHLCSPKFCRAFGTGVCPATAGEK